MAGRDGPISNNEFYADHHLDKNDLAGEITPLATAPPLFMVAIKKWVMCGHTYECMFFIFVTIFSGSSNPKKWLICRQPNIITDLVVAKGYCLDFIICM